MISHIEDRIISLKRVDIDKINKECEYPVFLVVTKTSSGLMPKLANTLFDENANRNFLYLRDGLMRDKKILLSLLMNSKHTKSLCLCECNSLESAFLSGVLEMQYDIILISADVNKELKILVWEKFAHLFYDTFREFDFVLYVLKVLVFKMYTNGRIEESVFTFNSTRLADE